MIKAVRILTSMLMLLIFSASYANIVDSLNLKKQNNDIIPVEQAFKLDAQIDTSQQQILITTNTANETYLYQDKFKFATDNKDINLEAAIFPPGEAKYDEELGNYIALSGKFTVKIPYTATQNSDFTLNISYQGCSKYGICYPPQQKEFKLYVSSNEAHNSVLELLEQRHIIYTSLGFLLLGILLSFTPCVLPILPILSRIIIGQKEHSTKKGFILSFSYVQGMSVAYALAGLLIASGGANLSAELQRPWIIIVTSIIFFILALSMFGAFNLKLPQSFEEKIDNLRRKQKPGSVLGVFIMGFVSSLIVSPCISAPLAGTLLYIAKTGDLLLGGLALYCLGLGMGIPLILIGSSLGNILPKAGAWMNFIKNSLGLMMIAMGLYLLTRLIPAPLNNSYQQVKTYAALEQVLTGAPHKEIIMLDFYANWCVACKRLQREVLEDNEVLNKLKNIMVLKADITNYDSDDKMLMKELQVFNPPSIIFFADGHEIPGSRIHAEVSKAEFLKKLNYIEQWTNKN